MGNFENLKVWHRAIELAVSIYKLTGENKFFQEEKSYYLNESKGISAMLTNLIKSRNSV